MNIYDTWLLLLVNLAYIFLSCRPTVWYQPTRAASGTQGEAQVMKDRIPRLSTDARAGYSDYHAKEAA